MSRDLVAALVESRARQDYEKLFLVRYILLHETLAKNEGAGARAADYLKKNLGPLGELPAQVVLGKATPFFRMNLLRCYSANSNDEDSLMEYSRNLVMMAVDSYFDLLPSDHVFHLRFEEQSHVVLPRLKVRVPVPGGEVTLRRADATTLKISTADGEIPIDLTDVAPEFKLLTFQVPYNSATLLLTCDPALFEKDYISSLEPDTKNVLSLIEQIDKALRLIRLVDEKLSAAINRYVEWYIPLINPNPDSTHYSFTAKNLPGVMFLSGSYRFLPLCEAIVHEYHHHELYVLLATQNVLGEETGRLFYSPWRTDARPLSGLFHAVHVFTAVADFYSRAVDMNIPELKVFEKDIEYRRMLLCHQLQIGLAQVPRADLPPLGQKIYEYMEGQLARQKAALGPKLIAPPKGLLTHFEDWSALYPELVPEVNLPSEFLSHSNA